MIKTKKTNLRNETFRLTNENKIKIKFLQIAEFNERTLLHVNSIQKPAYEDYVESDKLAREYALSLIHEIDKK